VRLLLILACAVPGAAATVTQASLSASADEQKCTAGPASTGFDASARQVFLRFVAGDLRAQDRLAVDWLDPSGVEALSTPWGTLPAARALCFLTQLPVAGFDAESKPGHWTVRVQVNGAVVWSQRFELRPDPYAGRIRIRSVAQTRLGGGLTELVVEGNGFDTASIVHVAQYEPRGGWRYISSLQPVRAEARKLTAHGPDLAPGEYMVLVYNSIGQLSQPSRLLIASGTGYKLPFPAGEPWVLTQGPYGSFSHFNRSLHAYDIAPVRSRALIAMRGGVVRAFDLGLRQTPHLRIFGNYISIDHGNGEYSHYGHLESGTFLVKTGQRVEQGQPLASAGNSGYTIGPGGGHHVHVHVTRESSISAQSVPFRFEDLPDPRYRGTVISRNTQVPGSFAARPAREWEASVAVAETWTEVAAVPRGSRRLQMSLDWQDPRDDLDLEIVSPQGRRYGWYANAAGLAKTSDKSEQFELDNPESGSWRVVVMGMRGSGARVPFRLQVFR